MAIRKKQAAPAKQQPTASEHWLPFPNFILKTNFNEETAQLNAELGARLSELQRQTAEKLEQINKIAEHGFSGKILTQPVYEGSSRHPLDSPSINTDEEDERRMRRYTISKEKYDKEMAAALKQDKEAHGFIDQLRQEMGAFELEKRSLLALTGAITNAKKRSNVFGAEQLLKYNEQQQEVLLGVLMDGKQAVIPPNSSSSTDLRFICELFALKLPVRLA